MKKQALWSLRLGFSAKQAETIAKSGIDKFVADSIKAAFDQTKPDFLNDSPSDLKDLRQVRQTLKKDDPEALKELLKKERLVFLQTKNWWLDKMAGAEFPLREKMTVFWHNHFVCTYQKVRVNNWIYRHNAILRENAFGNFRELTKKIIASNAMVMYLDNKDNRRDKLNENLSRELLELFTLGIGNYSEADIKNGAKGLAGLGFGQTDAVYRPLLENDDAITYLGVTGKLKLHDMVDALFRQPNAPYLVTRKILKWFVYDQPSEELVHYYGDYLRKQDYEIAPLLQKIFAEEYPKDNAGSKIKDPLVYLLQLSDELNMGASKGYMLNFVLRQQAMELYGQPNVKGWDGGTFWLSTQIYLQRQNIADTLCNGRSPLKGKKEEVSDAETPTDRKLAVWVDFDRSADNKKIINDLSERLLFRVTPEMQEDFERILKYDFDPKSEGAENAVIRLFNAMVKYPEFQLI